MLSSLKCVLFVFQKLFSLGNCVFSDLRYCAIKHSKRSHPKPSAQPLQALGEVRGPAFCAVDQLTNSWICSGRSLRSHNSTA